MVGQLDLSWAADGTLSVRGSGFAPHEQLMLTLTVTSGGSHIVSSGGSVAQSSGSSVQQSTTNAQADAQGVVRWASTVIVSGEAELSVSVQGNRGGRAEARLRGTRPR